MIHVVFLLCVITACESESRSISNAEPIADTEPVPDTEPAPSTEPDSDAEPDSDTELSDDLGTLITVEREIGFELCFVGGIWLNEGVPNPSQVSYSPDKCYAAAIGVPLGGSPEVYRIDLVARRIKRLTDNQELEYDPCVDDEGRVAWDRMIEGMLSCGSDLVTSEFKAHRYLSGEESVEVYAPSFMYIPDFGWSPLACGPLLEAYLAGKPRVIPLDQELLYTYADIAGREALSGPLEIEIYRVSVGQNLDDFIIDTGEIRFLGPNEIPCQFDLFGLYGSMPQGVAKNGQSKPSRRLRMGVSMAICP